MSPSSFIGLGRAARRLTLLGAAFSFASGVALNNGASAAPLKQSSPQISPSTTAQPPVTSGTRFSCQNTSGQYTVMYSPESQPGKVYPWATPSQLGGGWSPDRRCNEISRRLEMYRPDGLLEMRTGVENGYNTVCVTTQQNSACRIVLTVPPGQDPLATRDRVFENLAVADSGQNTNAVNTFTDDASNILDQIGEALNLSSPRPQSPAINLRPFLDRTDGGTGARLTGGATQSNPRLNPDRFR